MEARPFMARVLRGVDEASFSSTEAACFSADKASASGLKPASISTTHAALKRRSSTVAHVPMIAGLVSENRRLALLIHR